MGCLVWIICMRHHHSPQQWHHKDYTIVLSVYYYDRILTSPSGITVQDLTLEIFETLSSLTTLWVIKQWQCRRFSRICLITNLFIVRALPNLDCQPLPPLGKLWNDFITDSVKLDNLKTLPHCRPANLCDLLNLGCSSAENRMLEILCIVALGSFYTDAHLCIEFSRTGQPTSRIWNPSTFKTFPVAAA